MAFTLLDHPWMHPADTLIGKVNPVTAGFVFARFLGDRKKIEEMNPDDTWDKVIWDRTEDLERWGPVFADLLDRKLDVLAYFNNHYAGYAPGSLRQFQDMLYGQ